MKVDPITFAVIKSGLDSIADDMAYTVVRIARSEIVKDVMDFSAALCDADGQMVAQAKTIAQHLGAIPEAMAAVLAKFGDDLHDGDAVIMNDPYHGGMHLPDIFMFMPIFFEGKRRAFAVVICHHTDVGGRVPGSNASDSTEIYQEGLRIPPLKLYDRGVLNETLETLIKINVRVPDRVWGDLSRAVRRRAGRQARARASCSQRYGADEVEAYMRELLDYAERLTRAEITTWPKGTYALHRPHRQRRLLRRRRSRIKVAITVRDDGTLLVDYTGSSPQVKGALNSTLSFTHSLHLSQRALRAAEGHPEQRRRVPLHRGEGAGGLRAQSRSCRRRAPRARSPAIACSTPCSARWRRSCPTRAGGRRGRQQRHLHQRAAAQPQALHHRRHDLRRLGRPARQGRARGDHQRLAEPLQHAGRGDGGRASGARRGVCASCPTAAAPASGAAASASGAPTASWRPRRCCSCAPTA